MRCSVAMGSRVQALRQIGDAFRLCEEDARLADLHMPQMHCLLGVYSLSVNIKDSAIQQFNICLKSTNDTDLWLYCAMNLALCYLSGGGGGKTPQLMSVLDNVTPDKIRTKNTALTAFSHYLSALRFFLNQQFQPAQ